jgi:glycosyltransferase involved in cell wall biosynthesis
MTQRYSGNSIAVILPCYNEAPAIAKVISGFRAVLPEATIHVFDNASTDDTAEIARQAGARVIQVADRGKGNVVRRMFADVEADIYLMADGDGTYDPQTAPIMIDRLIADCLDMVVGRRVTEGVNQEYRPGHKTGNKVLTGAVASIFGDGFTDMLSGYRALSRRYVKSFPALSKGFEIETELTIHALTLRAPHGEVPTPYGARAEGTESKLSTWADGLRILKTILKLYMLERPRNFYLLLAAAGALFSLTLGLPVVIEYFETGLVPRFPTAILAASIMLGALLSATCAVILDGVVTGRRETKRLVYLGIAAPGPKP